MYFNEKIRHEMEGNKISPQNQKLLDNAKAEIASYKAYDYIIINDKLEKACNELESIFTAAKVRTDNTDHKWIKNLI